MSTARQNDRGGTRRWIVPAFCVLAAGAYAGVFLATGQVASAAWSAGIMLAYGAILVIFSRRSEVAAILRDDGRDERRASINLRASAVTVQVIALVAVVMAFIQLGRGHSPGDWGTMCAVTGLSYLGSVLFFSRRG